MNAALSLLISRFYDGNLAPDHLEDLRRSGLTDETIRAQFIRSVPPSMLGQLLGFDDTRIRSAMLLPFRSPAGGFLDHVRLKIFPALTGKDGHTIKYLQPRGSPPRLYFCAATLPPVLEGSAPLWLVEGEKKALAVAQLGLPALGVAGIEGWHVAGSRELLPDFDAIPLAGRIVELLPDGDLQTNPDVQRGTERFARALQRRGATPRIVLLPRELGASA